MFETCVLACIVASCVLLEGVDAFSSRLPMVIGVSTFGVMLFMMFCCLCLKLCLRSRQPSQGGMTVHTIYHSQPIQQPPLEPPYACGPPQYIQTIQPQSPPPYGTPWPHYGTTPVSTSGHVTPATAPHTAKQDDLPPPYPGIV